MCSNSFRLMPEALTEPLTAWENDSAYNLSKKAPNHACTPNDSTTASNLLWLDWSRHFRIILEGRRTRTSHHLTLNMVNVFFCLVDLISVLRRPLKSSFNVHMNPLRCLTFKKNAAIEYICSILFGQLTPSAFFFLILLERVSYNVGQAWR